MDLIKFKVRLILGKVFQDGVPISVSLWRMLSESSRILSTLNLNQSTIQASWTVLTNNTPGPLVSVQSHGAWPNRECKAHVALIRIRVHDEKQEWGLSPTVYAHPASHDVSKVPLLLLRDANMLQSRLLGAPTRSMGLINFPIPPVTSSGRCHRPEDQDSPLDNSSPLKRFKIWNTPLFLVGWESDETEEKFFQPTR